MQLQQIISKKLSIIIFSAAFVLTLPLIAVAQGKIAFTSNRDGNYEIYKMNSDGSNQIRLTTNSATDDDSSFSPDNSKIAFTSLRDGNQEIYVMNSDGSNQINLTNNAANDSDPTFSPDGSKIAFTSNRDGNDEIYVMNSDGSNVNRLTFYAGSDSSPSFSPDGSKIAFTSGRDFNQEIYVMNSSGTNQIRLTNNNSAVDKDPTFSPDGSKIAFTSDRDLNEEIYVMNSNGSNQINLTNTQFPDNHPTFSSDGSKIAFSSFRDFNEEIYVMNSGGSDVKRLTFTSPASESNPSWEFPAPPPTLSNVAVTSPVNEGGTATLTGSINNPNMDNPFTLVVNWGDGSLSQDYDYPAGTTSFSETHQYLDDNPTGTATDNYTIKYQLFDNNHFIGVAEETVVTVNNVNPIISNLAVNPSTVTVGNAATLTGNYTDPGYHSSNSDEQLTVNVNWGDGTQEFLVGTGAPAGFSKTHLYAAVGNYTINVTVTDNDTGATTQTIGVSVVPPPPPAAPTNLRVDTVGALQVTLRWTDNSNNESGFVVEQCRNKNCNNSVQIGQVGANVTTFTDTGLLANTQYIYRVRAFNAGGNSAYSDTVTAKTLRK